MDDQLDGAQCQLHDDTANNATDEEGGSGKGE